MKALLVLGLCLCSGLAFAKVESRDFDVAGLKKLRLKNSAGNITVSVSEDDRAHVRADKIKFGKNCELYMSKAGEELIVEVESKGWIKFSNCNVNFSIALPRETELILKSGSGNLDINGIKGAMDFKLGSGNAKINAEVEKLNVKSGSGSIDITGLVGNAVIKTGSGSVTLTYSQAPVVGALDIKSGSGDATLFFPESMKIMTDLKSGSGQIYNELGDTNDAAFKVTMKVGSGDVRIKKLQ